MAANKISKLIGVLALLAVVVISGCATKPVAQAEQNVFIGGQKGISINFQEGLPSGEIFEGDPVDIGIRAVNDGEFNIVESPVLCVSGPTQLNIQDSNPDTSINPALLTAKSRFGKDIVPGGQDLHTYSAIAPSVVGDLPITLSATSRYKYQTKAVANVCISSNVLSQTTGNDLCKPAGSKTLYSSSAPIQVSDLTQVITPTSQTKVRAILQFKVKNAGSGVSYDADTKFNQCIADSSSQHVNRASASANLGGVELICTPKPSFVVTSSGTTIVCQTGSEGIDANTREEILNINIDYYYVETVTKKVTVRNLPGGISPTESALEDSSGCTGTVNHIGYCNLFTNDEAKCADKTRECQWSSSTSRCVPVADPVIRCDTLVERDDCLTVSAFGCNWGG